jgi:hypothetical protein
MGTVIIPETHGGPRGIGHGGYVVGLLAGYFAAAAQVTLRKPAPLGVELDVACVDRDGAPRWELRRGEDVIADAIGAVL